LSEFKEFLKTDKYKQWNEEQVYTTAVISWLLGKMSF
jgi:hypothetical protein